jgi:hypothetical protein
MNKAQQHNEFDPVTAEYIAETMRVTFNRSMLLRDRNGEFFLLQSQKSAWSVGASKDEMENEDDLTTPLSKREAINWLNNNEKYDEERRIAKERRK